jgi:hypothetical protein
VFIFTWYVYVINNLLCNNMLLYYSTFILFVQIIVSCMDILDCIFCLFIKHCDDFFEFLYVLLLFFI